MEKKKRTIKMSKAAPVRHKARPTLEFMSPVRKMNGARPLRQSILSPDSCDSVLLLGPSNAHAAQRVAQQPLCTYMNVFVELSADVT